jgi:hypothetical protein
MLLVVPILVGVFGLAGAFVLVLILVLVLVLVLVLTVILIAELLGGAMTVREIALEATGKLVIVVGRSVEGEELLEIGSMSLLHCTH